MTLGIQVQNYTECFYLDRGGKLAAYMRILMVSQFWTPEPFLKALPFARELIRRGHEVEVLTGIPNYPGGAVYPGYKLTPFSREMIEGVRVNRVWLYPSHDGSGRRRILNYLSFAASAMILGPWVTRRPDVIYVYHPPATAALPAKWLSFLKRAPIVYDIQDLWPDSVVGTGMMPRSLRGMLERYCRWIYRKMDHLVVLSPGFRRTLAARGVNEEKIDVIENWCDEEALRPVPRDPELATELGLEDGFTVLFAGTMGVYQGLDAVLDAAELLYAAGDRVRFVFVGGGIERDRLIARASEIPTVQFLDRRPTEEMPALIAVADALLVHLKNEPLFDITIPSKTQAYLYAGRPIVMAVRGDAADIVREAEAGVLCEPEDPASIADGIRRLVQLSSAERERLGQNGAAYYFREMSLKRGANKFEAVFNRAVCVRRQNG